MATVVVVGSDAAGYRHLLGERHDVRSFPDPHQVPEQRADALVGPPAGILVAAESLGGLRLIQSTWAGVDALAGRTPVGVPLARVGGVFGPQMREFVFGHLLAYSQRVPARIQGRTWDSTPPGRLEGSVLGVLGTGSIGSAIARTARHFGMGVRGCSRRGRPEAAFDLVLSFDRIDDFLTGLDHLVVALPSTPQTRGLVDAEALARLAAGASLINVGRGDTVVVEAVVAALRAGRLAMAVLDVLVDEPLPDDDPLWTVPGLVITSHTAALSHPETVAPVIADNLDRLDDGRPLNWLVDPVAGY